MFQIYVTMTAKQRTIGVEGSACLSVESTDQTEVGLNTKILIIFLIFLIWTLATRGEYCLNL